MVRNKIVIISVLVLFLAQSLFLSCETRAAENILYVNDDGNADYTRIQDAIDNASSGDIITVFSGIYQENIVLDKQLYLKGITTESDNTKAHTPIIDGNHTAHVVSIIANNCTVSGFTIQKSIRSRYGSAIRITSNNNTITNNTITNNVIGIFLEESQSNTISNNNLSGNTRNAITLEKLSNHNTIKNNIIYNNSFQGVDMYHTSYNLFIDNNFFNNKQEGLLIVNSSYSTVNNNTFINNEEGVTLISKSAKNVIKSNTFTQNELHAIRLSSSFNNSILNNKIYTNLFGIYCNLKSSNNTIYANTIKNNTRTAVLITTNSDNNLLYHNNFIGNNISAYDEGINTWYNAVIQEGNYWETLGNKSTYAIPGGDNIDMYPLKNPYKEEEDSMEFLPINQMLPIIFIIVIVVILISALLIIRHKK